MKKRSSLLKHVANPVRFRLGVIDLTTKPSDANINKVDNDDGDTGNLVKVDAKQEKNAKRKGRKPCSTKPSEPTHIDSDKEDEIIFRKADKETDGSIRGTFINVLEIESVEFPVTSLCRTILSLPGQ